MQTKADKNLSKYNDSVLTIVTKANETVGYRLPPDFHDMLDQYNYLTFTL